MENFILESFKSLFSTRNYGREAALEERLQKEKMTYKDVRNFLIQKMEIALKRKWINKADKIAEILLKFDEVTPKSKTL